MAQARGGTGHGPEKEKQVSGAVRLLARIAAAGSSGLLIAKREEAAAAALMARGLAADEGGLLRATPEGLARAAREAGGEAAFLAQHRTLARRRPEGGVGPETLVDLDESPLAWLARRKDRDGRPLLAPEEVLAGERLRADFTRGQMTPRVTANWEASIARGPRGAGGAGVDLADAAIAARTRVSRALDAVGPELAGALVDVCCFLKGLEEVERDRRWPARGAKLVLGLGLARLARHYGYVPDKQGPGRILSWGADGSRPTIDGG
ncbi:DUF6456 domain-containing protein [Hansschlegelia quercus]|uniref:DUF6456 domain-containing protein n=1 Tax=Hansschlegelia quercus TaxID=2528245 RepID=A0A4Q9GGD1_9HYPH|nr:DUF6456 domain-containing protein [Hansschlegelia quercus]TBN47946.1 hypothetical protein EYR15_15115 [Hansschlegelia quercus]